MAQPDSHGSQYCLVKNASIRRKEVAVGTEQSQEGSPKHLKFENADSVKRPKLNNS